MDVSILIMAIAGAVLFVLALIKFYILVRATRRKTIRRWFYFKQQEIFEAPTTRAAGLRRAQNELTAEIFVLVALAAILLILFRS